MRPFYISVLALSLLAVQSPNVLAEEGQVHLDAHEHGAGELMAAFEGNAFLVELRLPGMDAVGFEHAPENDAQHAAIDQTLDKLKSATDLIELPAAAKCELEDAHITSPFKEGDHDEDKHAHEQENEHEHEGEEHSEFMAEYHFRCDAPQNFDSLNVKVFSAFPTLEEIVYQVVGPNGQLGGELEPNKTKIDL